MSKAATLPGDPALDDKLDAAFGPATGPATYALEVGDPVPPTLAASLAAVQATIPEVLKAETAKIEKEGKKGYTYNFADLSAVTRVILPRLGAVGLSWVTMPTLVDGRLVLVYKLMHVSGEVLEGVYPLPQNGGPQDIGGAITYARRYALCSVTGVAPSDDDDATQAQAAHKRQQDGYQRGPAEMSTFEKTAGANLLAVPTAEQCTAAGPVLMAQAFVQAVDFAACLNEHQAWGERVGDKTWAELMTARIAWEVDAADDGDRVNELWKLLKDAGLYTPEVAAMVKERGAAIKERNAKAFDTLVQQVTTASLEDMLANPSPVAESIENAHRQGRITLDQRNELLALGNERHTRLQREQNQTAEGGDR